MNRPLKRLSIAVLVMFLALMVNVNYLQAFEAPSLASQPDNVRTVDDQAMVQRGPIVTSDGMTIAESKLTSGGTYQREYPGGAAFAPVTGFTGVNGSGGLEQSEDSLLSGSSNQLAFRNLLSLLTNKPQEGATVTLTINAKAQEAAYQGLVNAFAQNPSLKGQTGGVVAIDPSTGAILAMASYPSYNPEEFATADGTQFNKLDSKLIEESPSPLVNNATQTTLAPGSTFKIITSSAYFSQNPSATINSEVYSPPVLTLPQTSSQLHNDDDESCDGAAPPSYRTQIITAFAQSCDTTFANLGMTLGTGVLNSKAEQFGFNSALTIQGVTTSQSSYVMSASPPLVAFSGIGQFNDEATPLQEAMLSAAIAHNGTLMKPYIIQSVTASDLSVISSQQSQVLSQADTPAVASKVRQMMVAVTQQPEGTGAAFSAANEGGLVIAGKTGTAQTINGQQPNAVFTGFAPAGTGQTPKIAVGVMISKGGFGATTAGPIAVAVMKAYLASAGQG